MAEHPQKHGITFPLGPVIAAAVTILLSISAAGVARHPGGTGFASAAETHVITAISAEEKKLSFYDGGNGRLLASRTLEFRPSVLRPTPGGVSVFVAYKDAPYLDVFSTETFEFQRRNEIFAAGVEELVFSSDGSRLYAFFEDDTRGSTVQEYQHEMLEIRPSLNAPAADIHNRGLMGGSGRLIYTWGENGLRSIFTANLQEIARYEEPVEGLIQTSEGEVLLAISRGELRVLDPRSLEHTENQSGTSTEKNDPASQRYSGDIIEHNGRIYVLTADRSGVDVYSAGRNLATWKEQGIPLPGARIVLPETARGLVSGASGVLIPGDSGRWYGISGGRELTRLFDTDGDGASDIAAASDTAVDLFRTAVIRRDGSFACF